LPSGLLRWWRAQLLPPAALLLLLLLQQQQLEAGELLAEALCARALQPLLQRLLPPAGRLWPPRRLMEWL
jgi:hypothetical protein